MTITPDTKDWTWVLQRPCPECGFDTQGFPVEAVPGMIMANAAAWQPALEGDARTRPEPDKWSPLEYACHVRDVFRLYDQRLELMLSQNDPLFPNWDQDETAVADRYGEQDPAEVAAALRQAAFAIAGRFESVTGEQWQRTGAAATAPASPWRPSPATSCTTRCTISTTSPASAPYLVNPLR